MIKSPSTWLFICLSLFFFLVHADTIETVPGTHDTIVGDSKDVFSLTPGSAVYSADTGNLLLTTSLDAGDRGVMEEIGGVGNYIVIRTQQAQWCAGLKIGDCRKNSGFLGEVAFSIQFVQQAPPVDEILPVDEISLGENDIFSDEILPTSDDSSISLTPEENNSVLSELRNDDNLLEAPDMGTSEEASSYENVLEEIVSSSPQEEITQEEIIDPISVLDETTILTEGSDSSVIHE